MMKTGKILKVRLGHEANCSSGMVGLVMLMLGAVTYLPLSLITATVQAAKLKRDNPKSKWQILYWVIPQVLGLGLFALQLWIANDGYGLAGWLLELAIAFELCFALAVTAGYIIVRRLRYPFLLCLLVPLILIFVFGLYARVRLNFWLWEIF
jgi:predicted lysophospholipase L1 biosynthesis ABC-type transport system permease subunit